MTCSGLKARNDLAPARCIRPRPAHDVACLDGRRRLRARSEFRRAFGGANGCRRNYRPVRCSSSIKLRGWISLGAPCSLNFSECYLTLRVRGRDTRPRLFSWVFATGRMEAISAVSIANERVRRKTWCLGGLRSPCMHSGGASKSIRRCVRIPPLPFQEALTIATFEPGVYEVVRTFAP